MNVKLPCHFLAVDEDVARRIEAYLPEQVCGRRAKTFSELERQIASSRIGVIIVDVHGAQFRQTLPKIRSRWPDFPLLTLAAPGSEPARCAAGLNAFATFRPDFDGEALRTAVARAGEYALAVNQLKLLRRGADAPAAGPADRKRNTGHALQSIALRELLRPLRRLGDVPNAVQGIVEGAADTLVVLRAGVIGRTGDDSVYRLLAGVGCTEALRALEWPLDDPLPRWLERRAQFVTRTGLERLHQAETRLLLEDALNLLTAELMVPLQGRDKLLGWLFIGGRADETPFDDDDTRQIVAFAEHLATAMENGALYEQLGRQKAFAETLLHSLPTGIIAVDEKARILWFSKAAADILGPSATDVAGQPAAALGSRIEDLLRRALEGEAPPGERDWIDPLTRRHLALSVSPLDPERPSRGAVAFLHDRTREDQLAAKQRELERTAFWTELAAGMSHEIRNPLVAIKTFAQLLPERYADADFRSEFSRIVSREVDRLDRIIHQLNRYANLPRPVLESIDIKSVLQKAVDAARQRTARNGIDLRIRLPRGLPPVRGDAAALADCFAHLLANALEAVTLRDGASVELSARTLETSQGPDGLAVAVADNGAGIAPEIRDNLFSPFCTTKTGGMGLGLPIVQRTVSDHNGSVHIDTGERGTTVTVFLPAEAQDKEPLHETPAHR